MVATTGALLLEQDAVEAVRSWLLPRATLVTPNAPEAGALLGWTIESSSQLASAARVLVEDLDARAALVKGADLPGEEIIDVYYDGERIELFRSPRIETTSMHGSGCALASAIAAYVARGSGLLDAIRQARRWVRRGIENAPPLGHGRGPLDLFGEA
jgi:hydroxymethylpyrimidine/phosphomethylpyrimidine kinase